MKRGCLTSYQLFYLLSANIFTVTESIRLLKLFLTPQLNLSSGAFETPLLIKHVVARSVDLPVLCHTLADLLPLKHMSIPGTLAYSNKF